MAQAAVAVIDTSWISSSPPSYEQSMQLLQENCAPVSCSTKIEVSIDPSLSRSVSRKDFPRPPPLPDAAYYRRYHLQKVLSVTRSCGSHVGYSCVPKETVNTWDKLFEGGYQTDVRIFTEDGGVIPAHSNVLSIASPVLKHLLKQQKGKSRHHSFSITGVPYDAARVFIRFLYSSRDGRHENTFGSISFQTSFISFSELEWTFYLFKFQNSLKFITSTIRHELGNNIHNL